MSLPPRAAGKSLATTPASPGGVPLEKCDDMCAGDLADRSQFLEDFLVATAPPRVARRASGILEGRVVVEESSCGVTDGPGAPE